MSPISIVAACICISLYLSAGAAQRCLLTKATTEGPYYKPGAPQRWNQQICDYDPAKNGTHLKVVGRVREKDCVTGVKSELDIWTADPQGDYSNHTHGLDYTCRGKLVTDGEGNFEFYTVLPGWYQFAPGQGYRPAHIHYKVTRVGDNNTLTTQQYFENDPNSAIDAINCPDCYSLDPSLQVPLQGLAYTPDGQKRSFISRFDIYLE